MNATAAASILIALLAQQQPSPGPEAELDQKLAKATRALVLDHVSIAKKCRELKLARQAAKEWSRVLALDPDHAEARAALGHKRVKGEWVAPGGPAPTDGGREGLDEIWPMRAALAKKAVKELTPVLELAAGAGLAARARALAILLLDYDAESAAARKALGQILTPEGWRTKEEVAEAEALAKRVAETAEPLTATEASSYESRLGVTLQKVRTPRCRLEGSLSDAEMKDIGRLVEAALEDLTESAGLPMQKGLTRFTAIVCRTREEYEKAVDELADARSESDRALLKRLAGAWMSSPRGFILSPRGTIESYRDGAVHALSHLLFLEWCVPEKAPPWLSEGAAYWATTRITKTALTYCIGRETSASTREWTGLGEWRGQARSWAREGGGPTVRQVMEAQMNSLDSDKIVKAWSLFDYMVRKRSQGLRALVKRVALGDGREESVRRAFVVKSYEELDAQWREYVNETY